MLSLFVQPKHLQCHEPRVLASVCVGHSCFRVFRVRDPSAYCESCESLAEPPVDSRASCLSPRGLYHEPYLRPSPSLG